LQRSAGIASAKLKIPSNKKVARNGRKEMPANGVLVDSPRNSILDTGAGLV
jgi:hypothetical protein